MKRTFIFVLILISCICLLTGCTTSKSQNPEESSTGNDITINISKSSEDYKNDDGVLLLSYSGDSANVDIKNNRTAADAINASLTSAYDSFTAQLSEYVSRATNDYNACSPEELAYWNSFIFTRNISVERCDSGVISLVYMDDYYLGGAHGGSLSSAKNYDAETGELLTLGDLAADKQTLTDYVIPYLLWLTEKPGFADGMSGADEDAFKSVFEDGWWYLSESGLVVICNEYTIGPYVIGTTHLEIPYKDLDGILLDKWMPAEI